MDTWSRVILVIPNNTGCFNLFHSLCSHETQDFIGSIFKRKDLIMKAYVPATLIAILFMLLGCATSSTIPQGAKSIGHYAGSFSGFEYQGDSRMTLYEMPDGRLEFSGSFSYDPRQYDLPSMNLPDAENAIIGFKGQAQANTLNGMFFGNVSGTISGMLSDDRTAVKGQFVITTPTRLEGVWEAQKK
jgi:hypothetical protein